jgi:tRNA (guanine9-N1)-methyltransferase
MDVAKELESPAVESGQSVQTSAPEADVDVAQAESATVMEPEQPAQPSKSSLKKAARREKFAEFKLERRAKEKRAKKEKKRIIAEKRAAGELDEEDEPKPKKRRVGPPFGGRVIMDLGFDEQMTEKVEPNSTLALEGSLIIV